MIGQLPRLQGWGLLCAVAVTATMTSLIVLPTAAQQADLDYDCTDFDSRSDAQDYYEAQGGPIYDPFNLDDNDDGEACEEWRRDYERSAAGAGGINGLDNTDTDCADYDSQVKAQRYFDEDGGSRKMNVDHLDPNHNGIACEEGEPG